MQAIYRVSGEQVETSESAAGPWHPRMQHGAAPAALIAWAAERLPADQPMRLVRLSLDLFRPVPVGALTIRSAIIRTGRKIQVAAIDLLADDVEVVRATALRVPQSDGRVPEEIGGSALDLPPPEASYDIPPERRVRCPFLARASRPSSRSVRNGSAVPPRCGFAPISPSSMGLRSAL